MGAVGAVACILWFAWGPAVGDGPDAEFSRRIGVRLVETRDASGPPAYRVEPGDVLFFTNVGTAYGAKNVINSVVVTIGRIRRGLRKIGY